MNVVKRKGEEEYLTYKELEELEESVYRADIKSSRALPNSPNKPNGPSHSYFWNESTFDFRGIMKDFPFLFILLNNFFKQTV